MISYYFPAIYKYDLDKGDNDFSSLLNHIVCHSSCLAEKEDLEFGLLVTEADFSTLHTIKVYVVDRGNETGH